MNTISLKLSLGAALAVSALCLSQANAQDAHPGKGWTDVAVFPDGQAQTLDVHCGEHKYRLTYDSTRPAEVQLVEVSANNAATPTGEEQKFLSTVSGAKWVAFSQPMCIGKALRLNVNSYYAKGKTYTGKFEYLYIAPKGQITTDGFRAANPAAPF